MSQLKTPSTRIDSGQWDQPLAELQERIAKLSKRVSREARAGREIRTLAFFQQILELHDLQTRALDLAIPRPAELQESAADTLFPPLLRQYIVSSLFLEDCYAYLSQGKAEWLHAVTGTRFGNCFYTLERMIAPELETQSAARATAVDDSVFWVLMDLAESDHLLHGVFHSHCFSGIPGPSSIDQGLQRRLESGGYPAIQAIFSEDGYIRFFGGQNPFEIKVYGTGAEKINEKVYRLTDGR